MLDKFKIGHYTDMENGTGCSVFIALEGATGGASVRGAAPATRETDLLKDGKSVQLLNAVVLSGGSAFGLEAACGVVQYLKENEAGFDTGAYKVPIVAGASLYDLEFNGFAFPDKAAGYAAACAAQKDNFVSGSIGAGTGATVSKLGGAAASPKSGLGVQTYNLNGLEIAVFAAVNAVGDIIKDGRIVLGAQGEDGQYLDSRRLLSAGSFKLEGKNTTIVCILTNADLTKEQANILADVAHDGLALSLSPAHTRFDGDAVFVMASGQKKTNINILSALIPELTANAIRSVAVPSGHIHKKVSKVMMSVMNKMLK